MKRWMHHESGKASPSAPNDPERNHLFSGARVCDPQPLPNSKDPQEASGHLEFRTLLRVTDPRSACQGEAVRLA